LLKNCCNEGESAIHIRGNASDRRGDIELVFDPNDGVRRRRLHSAFGGNRGGVRPHTLSQIRDCGDVCTVTGNTDSKLVGG